MPANIFRAVRQSACFSRVFEQSDKWGKRICFNGAEFDAMAVLIWPGNSNIYHKTLSSPHFERLVTDRPLVCPKLCILRVN
jgi:hypothetical protein